ncbi:FAD-dependent oxidoreductase [Nocardioides sp. TF02-7]|uniref:flavin monoamine oxidase family protein n=1 Tax=Nocardioides sp. TF02-7 TaxID=2917724 RepID=UPI001F05E0DC|nr:FAD-dependent oxidoreductase [Nocardioides sp. TF02-7]UMG94529.1 FAD-dependent oxidoreductase [Nocardioides sp. TF02-7]
MRAGRVGVVGAGLAGLACAWTLHCRGYEVVVLEARERVGGRAWSTTLANGAVVERGGEWIDADQHAIRRLCAELRLPLAPHGVRFHRRRVRGAVPTLAALEETLTRVAAAVPPGDCGLAAAFEAALGADGAADPTYLRVATSTAGDPAVASARFHVARAESGRVEGAGRVVGGNQRIATALAAALGDRVRTGTPVGEVEVTADGAALTTTRGERIQVDRAVVAVPLALLGELAWGAGAPRPVARRAPVASDRHRGEAVRPDHAYGGTGRRAAPDRDLVGVELARPRGRRRQRRGVVLRRRPGRPGRPPGGRRCRRVAPGAGRAPARPRPAGGGRRAHRLVPRPVDPRRLLLRRRRDAARGVGGAAGARRAARPRG